MRKLIVMATLLWPAVLFADAPPTASQAAVAAQGQLDASASELAALRETIRAEKVPMNEELGRLEGELAALRRRYDETSRRQDTRTLEVANLGGAIKLRQDENAYVANLMDEYTRSFPTLLHVSEMPHYSAALEAARLAPQDPDLSLGKKLERQAELLKVSLGRLGDLVGGTRFAGQAVGPQGTLAQGQFAMLGPVVLFADPSGKTAGLALPQAGSPNAAIRPLDEAATQGVEEIVEKGEGLLPFDPTRGGALSELVARGSLIHYFKKGGPIMWPLLLVSILAMTVVIERLVFLASVRKRRDTDAVDEILARVENGDMDEAKRVGRKSTDFVARALTYALEHREKSLSNALSRSSGQELVRFTRGISILDTCVTMAPLLGLLGTVTGMMSSFGALGGAELSAPAQITGGIAEALIATAFGLGIAVTALIPMNYLHSKSDQARHELEDAATHLELLMKPWTESESASAEPPPGRAAARSDARHRVSR